MKQKPETPPPKPPAGLSEKSQSLWRAVVGKAKTTGRQTLLQEALKALDRADQCRAVVDSEGLTSTTERSGAVHIHPAAAMELRFRAQFLTAWQGLGLGSQGGLNYLED